MKNHYKKMKTPKGGGDLGELFENIRLRPVYVGGGGGGEQGKMYD
jgi:hypothetical protein